MGWDSSAGGIVPEGEGLRRAIQWLGVRRQEEESTPVWKLIDEAALRFLLSPLEVHFLMTHWGELARDRQPRQP